MLVVVMAILEVGVFLVEFVAMRLVMWVMMVVLEQGLQDLKAI